MGETGTTFDIISNSTSEGEIRHRARVNSLSGQPLVQKPATGRKWTLLFIVSPSQAILYAYNLFPSLDLPQTNGWLPKWQLIVAVMAVFNTVQNFSTLKLTRRIYDNVPPTSGESLIYTILYTLANRRIHAPPSDRSASPHVCSLDIDLCCCTWICGLQYPKQNVRKVLTYIPDE